MGRQVLKQIGKKLGNSGFNKETNDPHAYLDKIVSDFGLDWGDANDEFYENEELYRKYYDDPASLDPEVLQRLEKRRIDYNSPPAPVTTPAPAPDTSMKIDGDWGPKSRQAVLEYQGRHPNLAQDGEIGLRTYTEMLRDDARSRAAGQAGEAGVAAGDAVAGEDRAVRLAREYGAGLGHSIVHRGAAPDLRAAFSPSPETGAYDADALEVATTLRIPHRTDIPMTRKILERDGDILYAAIGAHAKVLADEKRRQQWGKSSRRR